MSNIIEELFGNMQGNTGNGNGQYDKDASDADIMKSLISQITQGQNLQASSQGGRMSPEEMERIRKQRGTEMIGGMGGNLMNKEALDAIRAAASRINPEAVMNWLNQGSQAEQDSQNPVSGRPQQSGASTDYRDPKSYLFRTNTLD